MTVYASLIELAEEAEGTCGKYAAMLENEKYLVGSHEALEYRENGDKWMIETFERRANLLRRVANALDRETAESEA